MLFFFLRPLVNTLSTACSHVPVVQDVWVAFTSHSTHLWALLVLLENHEFCHLLPLAGTQGASGVWAHTAWRNVLKLQLLPKPAVKPQVCSSEVWTFQSVCMMGPVVTLQNSEGSCWEFFSPFCDFGLWLWQNTAGCSLSLLSTPGKLLESSHWVYGSA